MITLAIWGMLVDSLSRGVAVVDGLPAWQAVAVVGVLSLILARIVQVGGDALVTRVTARIDGEIDDVVLQTIHPPLYVTIVVLGLYFAVTRLTLGDGIALPLRAGTLTILLALWAGTLVRLGRRVSDAITSAEQVQATVVPIFQNVWSAVVLGVSLFALLALWNVDVTPLLASAGIAGIVVGFAARDTIANLFGSVALYLDGTYEVGDFIVLESGERGRVEDVSVRSTVIRTRDDVLVTVPNSVLNAARVVNESAPRRRRRIRVPLGVAYGTDFDLAEREMLAAAAEEELVLEQPPPRVRFREFGDSALQLELLCWASDPVLRGRVRHRLNKAIYRRFADAGITIPFPQREISMATQPTESPAPPSRAND